MSDEEMLEQVRNTKVMAYRERIKQYGEGAIFTSDVLRDCMILLIEFEKRLLGPNVPEGWKLVPIEPTHEMVKTYKNAMRVYIVAAKAAGTFERWKKDGRGYVIPEREKCYARWTAMLGACPPFATRESS